MPNLTSKERQELGALAGRVLKRSNREDNPTALRHLVEACEQAGLRCAERLRARLGIVEERERVISRLDQLHTDGQLVGAAVRYTRLLGEQILVTIIGWDSSRKEVIIKTSYGARYPVDPARITFVS